MLRCDIFLVCDHAVISVSCALMHSPPRLVLLSSGVRDYEEKNRAWLQGQIGNPDGADKVKRLKRLLVCVTDRTTSHMSCTVYLCLHTQLSLCTL